jgi:hypothetical protein
MPPVELAAAILPWFSSRAPTTEAQTVTGIVQWLTTGSDRGSLFVSWTNKGAFENPDLRAVAEAIQVLERACLLMRSETHADYSLIGLTRLGWHALQTSTVRQNLGLSHAAPGGGPHGGR